MTMSEFRKYPANIYKCPLSAGHGALGSTDKFLPSICWRKQTINKYMDRMPLGVNIIHEPKVKQRC